jgi:hypothetical protein
MRCEQEPVQWRRNRAELEDVSHPRAGPTLVEPVIVPHRSKRPADHLVAKHPRPVVPRDPDRQATTRPEMPGLPGHHASFHRAAGTTPLVDAGDVTRGIRQTAWPALRAEGFAAFTGRTAWRYVGEAVDVVNFQSRSRGSSRLAATRGAGRSHSGCTGRVCGG